MKEHKPTFLQLKPGWSLYMETQTNKLKPSKSFSCRVFITTYETFQHVAHFLAWVKQLFGNKKQKPTFKKLVKIQHEVSFGRVTQELMTLWEEFRRRINISSRK